jgi:hypothetical protein
LVVSGCNSPEVFELIEEAFDEVPVFVEEVTEGRFTDELWHGADIGPSAARTHLCAQKIRIISAVSEQDIACRCYQTCQPRCGHRRLALQSI